MPISISLCFFDVFLDATESLASLGDGVGKEDKDDNHS